MTLKFKGKRDYLIILASFVLATIILYGWFWVKRPEKLQFVYQNWDGPNYVIVAKSFYNPKIIDQINYIWWLKAGYFACHFPLYPFFIKIFSFIGYFRAMLFVSLLFSLLMLFVFYKLVKRFKFSAHPLLLTLPFIFLPPRWFIVSHVGSSEPVFMFFILLLFYFFLEKKYFLSALMGFFACMTRFQGLIFFAGIEIFLFGEFLFSKRWFFSSLKKAALFLLMPLGTSLVFLLFQIQYHNFWQFFSAMKEWQHLVFPPFMGFSYPHYFIPTFWLEGKAIIYVLYSTAIFKLFANKKYPLAICGLLYFLPLLFLVHMDLSRYALPLAPFLFLSFEKVIAKRSFLLGLLLVLPAVYAYSITFMCWNLAP